MSISNHDRISSIKRHADGRWPDVISSVCGIDSQVLDGKHHPCPKCGGTDRFRIIDEEAGALHCNQCFNKKNGDGIAAVQWVNECSFVDALSLLEKHLGIYYEATANVDIVEAVCQAKRMPREALEAYGVKAAMRGRAHVARVPVYDAEGNATSHFDLRPDKKGWFKKGRGTSGLFLPGEMPKPGETWYLAEGVKDAATLNALGYRAAGLPRASLPRPFANLFKGVHIVIVHDLDRAGVNGAETTARVLAGIAASVKIARLPGEIKDKGGDDVRDVVHGEHGEQRVHDAIENAKLVEQAEPIKPPETLEESRRTEVANADRLVKKNLGQLLYIKSWQRFSDWDGKRWDLSSLGAERRATESNEQLWQHVSDAAAFAEERDIRTVAAFAKASCSAKGIAGTLQIARSDPRIIINHDELDSHHLLLNLDNGVLDLKTGELRAHHPKYLMTRISPVAFDPAATAVRWNQFIEEVTGGDKELHDFLQCLVGYWLTGLVDTHLLPIFYGTGCNGKSVFLGTILGLLGSDYGGKSSSDLLLQNKGSHPTEKADLFGRRLMVCIEADEGRRLNESDIKELTGGDRQKARRMREDFWEFAPTAKLCLAANHRPDVSGGDHGLWRRLCLVPFTVTICDEKIDRKLPEKLKGELPGILNWALVGCQKYLKAGLPTPACITAESKKYKDENDPIGQFIDEECKVEPNASIKARALHHAFCEWASNSGIETMTPKRLGMKLEERGFPSKKTSSARLRVGLRLRTSDDDNQPEVESDEGGACGASTPELQLSL